jgi:hypothetical protein
LVQEILLPAQVQDPPGGRHIGVVEVVLVDVEVVGVVVLVDVEVVGVVVLVDVEVVGVVVEVLVEVLVVLLVDVLVEVVLVVVVVGAAVVVVVSVSHVPRRSPWRRWPSTALLGTSMVFSSGVPGLWQMVSFC